MLFFWEDKEAEKEFYRRILESPPFKRLLSNYLNSNMIESYAKSLTMGAVKEIIHYGFDAQLRDACLKEIGEICWHMTHECGNINTDTDIDSFIKNMRLIRRGYKKFKRKSNLVYEEIHIEKCLCPIINEIKSPQNDLVCYECGRSSRKECFQMVMKKPIEVKLLESIICNDSDVCRWVINLEPEETTPHN